MRCLFCSLEQPEALFQAQQRRPSVRLAAARGRPATTSSPLPGLIVGPSPGGWQVCQQEAKAENGQAHSKLRLLCEVGAQVSRAKQVNCHHTLHRHPACMERGRQGRAQPLVLQILHCIPRLASRCRRLRLSQAELLLASASHAEWRCARRCKSRPRSQQSRQQRRRPQAVGESCSRVGHSWSTVAGVSFGGMPRPSATAATALHCYARPVLWWQAHLRVSLVFRKPVVGKQNRRRWAAACVQGGRSVMGADVENGGVSPHARRLPRSGHRAGDWRKPGWLMCLGPEAHPRTGRGW